MLNSNCITLNNNLADVKKLLWSGNVTGGFIYFDTRYYNTYEIYIEDGCLLRGVKYYDAVSEKNIISAGATKLIYDGTNFAPGLYFILADCYDDHIYIQENYLYTPTDNGKYTSKTICDIYGVI